jgi:hypothetical protein
MTPTGWITVRRGLTDEQWNELIAKHQVADTLLWQVEQTVRSTLGFEMAREFELVRVKLASLHDVLAGVAAAEEARREIEEEIAEELNS